MQKQQEADKAVAEERKKREALLRQRELEVCINLVCADTLPIWKIASDNRYVFSFNRLRRKSRSESIFSSSRKTLHVSVLR
jgi:hypothetical protein